ncbi:MAG: methyltransferase domain-containing protein [Acidobacteria bacterium]|nr:methyltransferase domain-containing protein [Acidobacteriota bacterium]
MDTNTRRADVQAYYGETLKSSQDLKTSACCPVDSVPAYQRDVLKLIEPEILDRFYGCGSPMPESLDGCTVLDLGCGTGRDVYLAAKLVGPNGHVIGVDMTEAQLEVAQRHLSIQMERFGFSTPNVRFHLGNIEDLRSLGIADDSVDVVISNCVINLSADKGAVFKEIFRVLKPGGELFFADIFADRRVPLPLQSDPVLVGECLAGAMYVEDFRRLMRELGCLDVRILSTTPVQLEDDEIVNKVGGIRFYSRTIRAFKLNELEDICEDYGQRATYLGSITSSPDAMTLDDHHVFPKGKPMAVCGNTASMLQATRFGKHFHIEGDRSQHYGAFDCSPLTTSGASCC